ncbi:lipase, GDSL, partial [Tanacetum coccineum]
DFTYGANFASGGAGALVESHAGFVVDLKTQLQYFEDLEKQFTQNLGAAETNQLLSDAVYLFSCGGNDYLSPVGNNDSILYPYTHEEYVGMVIGNLSNVFKGIYAKGGRKFGIVTVPQLDCLPSIRAERPGNAEELGIIVSLHNHKLSKKLQELENQLEGFTYAKFDPFTEISKRMTNPSKYGIFAELLVQLLSRRHGLLLTQKETRPVAEVVLLEGFVAAAEREECKSLNYVITVANIFSSTLVISAKLQVDNLQRCFGTVIPVSRRLTI